MHRKLIRLPIATLLLLASEVVAQQQRENLISLGEPGPRPQVNSITETGEFPEVGLSYRLIYSRMRERHRFEWTINERRVRIDVSATAFPDLDVNAMTITHSPAEEPALLATMEYGPRETECFNNAEPRSSLTLRIGRETTARTWTFVNCREQSDFLGEPEGVRIRQ